MILIKPPVCIFDKFKQSNPARKIKCPTKILYIVKQIHLTSENQREISSHLPASGMHNQILLVKVMSPFWNILISFVILCLLPG